MEPQCIKGNAEDCPVHQIEIGTTILYPWVCPDDPARRNEGPTRTGSTTAAPPPSGGARAAPPPTATATAKDKEKNMARYTVPLTSWANITVTVEAPDGATPEEVASIAEAKAHASLCHYCSSESNSSLEVGDEWTAAEGDDGKPEVCKLTE